MANNFVVLAILADPTTGGWASYTSHLAYGIRELGYEPLIVKLSKVSEKKPRDFGRGLTYWNTSGDDIKVASQKLPTLITAVGKNKREYATDLITAGASVVIHDPTELDPTMISILSGSKVITIRQIISDKLADQGISNVFVPHPYQRSPHKAEANQGNAVAISRVDFDKNTHLIIEANKKLQSTDSVIIHGTLNTLYHSVRLKITDENWKRNYAGAWSHKEDLWYPVRLASQAKAVVDLSTISGDGGGTQYSFLEAIDAMKPLIIHSGWITGNKNYDVMNEVISANVATAEELIAALGDIRPANTEANISLLENHSAVKIAKQVIELL
jgi:hypothetical protein